MRELTVVTIDRLGLLADITELLESSGVRIESLFAEASKGAAILRLCTRDTVKAKQVLAKAGYAPIDSRVLVVRLSDKPGELSVVSRLLADNAVNILNLYLLSQQKGERLFALETTDNEAAKALLEAYL